MYKTSSRNCLKHNVKSASDFIRVPQNEKNFAQWSRYDQRLLAEIKRFYRAQVTGAQYHSNKLIDALQHRLKMGGELSGIDFYPRVFYRKVLNELTMPDIITVAYIPEDKAEVPQNSEPVEIYNPTSFRPMSY